MAARAGDIAAKVGFLGTTLAVPAAKWFGSQVAKGIGGGLGYTAFKSTADLTDGLIKGAWKQGGKVINVTAPPWGNGPHIAAPRRGGTGSRTYNNRRGTIGKGTENLP